MADIEFSIVTYDRKTIMDILNNDLSKGDVQPELL